MYFLVPEETHEEWEPSNKGVTPSAKSSSSPEKAMIPPLSLPSYADDFRVFQDLMKWLAESLQIPLEKVQEPQHSQVDIWHISPQGKISLPINKALSSPACNLRHYPIYLKKADKNVTFLTRERNISSLIAPQLPGCRCGQWLSKAHSRVYPSKKVSKCLDLLSRRSYSSAVHQFQVANYQNVMVKIRF